MATELGTRFDEDSVSSPAEEAAQGLYGSMTIGSSEAIMLGLIAHRFIWEQRHRVLLANPGLGKPVDPRDRPVVLMSSNVHGCRTSTAGTSTRSRSTQQSVSRDKLSNLLDSLRTAVQALDSSTWPTGGDRAAQRKLRPLARHTACLC